jgi:hypothetical protein
MWIELKAIDYLTTGNSLLVPEKSEISGPAWVFNAY